MSTSRPLPQPHPCELLLQVLSHELRSPLCVLRSYVHVLSEQRAEGRLPEEAYLQRMERVLRQMERLVGDLLDLGRLDADRLPLRPVRADLGSLCRQVAEAQQVAHGRPVVMRLPAQPVYALVDEDRMDQVLSNLIGNAMAYSPPQARVSVSLAAEADSAVLAVADEGPGIPEDQIERIFERFHRGPGVEGKGNSGGLGLGLAICKELVERQGGRIWAESAPGEGSTFFVALPLA